MPAEPRRVFFDSNTLLYLISADAFKSSCIQTYLEEGGSISVQVLNEFVNVARRKHRLEISDIRPVLEDLCEVLDVAPLTLEIHKAGIGIIERHKLSTYDAMIVAAALQSGCDTLLSEDMQDGLVVDGRLTIRNPFAAA
jgi:predicted nucleic acid-binding protein